LIQSFAKNTASKSLDIQPHNELRKLPAVFVNEAQFYLEEIEQKSRRIPEPKAGQLNPRRRGIHFIGKKPACLHKKYT
jgi:hypothetical protein